MNSIRGAVARPQPHLQAVKYRWKLWCDCLQRISARHHIRLTPSPSQWLSESLRGAHCCMLLRPFAPQLCRARIKHAHLGVESSCCPKPFCSHYSILNNPFYCNQTNNSAWRVPVGNSTRRIGCFSSGWQCNTSGIASLLLLLGRPSNAW